jgi:hypothetical protein
VCPPARARSTCSRPAPPAVCRVLLPLSPVDTRSCPQTVSLSLTARSSCGRVSGVGLFSRCSACGWTGCAAAAPSRVARGCLISSCHFFFCCLRVLSRLPSPPHSKAAIDAAKLLNIKKFSMSSNMNMEHDSMVVNRLVSLRTHTLPCVFSWHCSY